jgi:hypothetical protein
MAMQWNCDKKCVFFKSLNRLRSLGSGANGLRMTMRWKIIKKSCVLSFNYLKGLGFGAKSI